MAELHDSLVRSFRKRTLRHGFKDGRCGMPTYRPDVFLEKLGRNGLPTRQIAVEAEIQSTLFSEHTANQLLLLDEFIRLQDAKNIRVRGYLLVPAGKALRSQAASLLEALFPHGTKIQVA